MKSGAWWRTQLVLGGLVALTAIVHWLLPIDTSAGGGFGILPSAIVFRLVFPVLAVSLLVNGTLMAVRTRRDLGDGEGKLLIAQFAGILLVTALDLLPRIGAWGELDRGAVLLGLAVLVMGLVVAVVEIANWRAPTARPVRRR